MPEFSSVFSVKKSDRKLTRDELIRAIRFSIAAEYEAVQIYTQLAESIDDKLAITVLLDVSNEELEHAGEFLKLLRQLNPDEEKHYEDGYKEVEDMMSRLKKKK
ncbi:MAG TPA: ferritin family protein [Deltaproteobacteria bacterium]|jgi:rubrerythrin|nr:ferritin family protein [Deltaproteobacteria bacterium]